MISGGYANTSGAYLLFGYSTKAPSQGGKLGTDYDYIPEMTNQRFIAWPDSRLKWNSPQ